MSDEDLVKSPVTGATDWDEFVDDREVAAADDDKFSHRDVVSELHDLILSTPTPANIALYGAWGSGKSGIKNLLAVELEKDPCVFVQFDAFKYAADPLERQFLARIASVVLKDKKAEEFRDSLYQSSSTNTLSLKEIRANPLLRVIGWAAVAMLVAVLIVGAAAEWVFDTDASDAMAGVAAAIIPSGLLLAFLIGLVGKTLPVTTSRGQPSSDEQYEEKFRELVREVSERKKRLVVFIDELDRCAPDQVVEILATIRTFLDVEGCVFVVAADQQVLERSLSEKAPHTTPLDPDNPYYSMGSEYLDKVFHHQIAIPPVRHRSLTTFAVGLVEGRPGVWSELPDVRRTVSILIPSHVRSPRRVKALLNSFVHLHRLARRRVDRGMLEANLAERANELAVLTCLRLEFPLFARELSVHQSLTQLVRSADANETKPPWCLESEWQLAQRFINGDVATANLMEGSVPVEDAGTERPAADDNDERNEVLTSDLGRTQSQHLVAYLKRTARVPGPGADLIHLEHGGFGQGLEPTVAAQLERLAENGDRAGAVDLMRSISSSDASRGAVLMLSDLLRDAVGIEQTNIVAVLLATASACVDESLDKGPGSVDVVLDELGPYVPGLDATDLTGAFRLALRSTSEQAREIVARVVEQEEIRSDVGLASAVVHGLPRLDPTHDVQISDAVSFHLILSESALVASLADLDASDLTRILAFLVPQLGARINESPDSIPNLVDAARRALVSNARGLAEKLVVVVLRVDPRSDGLAEVLSELGTTSDPDLAIALLDVSRENNELATALLPHLAPGSIRPEVQNAAEACVGTLLARAVSAVVEAQTDEETALAWLAHLEEAGLVVPAASDATDAATANLPSPIGTLPDVERRERGLSLLLRATSSPVVSAERIAGEMALVLQHTENPLGDAVMGQHLERWAPRVCAIASTEAQQALVTFISQCFLAEPARTNLWVQIAGDIDTQPESPLSLEDLSAWRDTFPTELHTLARWIRVYRPTPDEAYQLLEPGLGSAAIDDGTSIELRRYADSLTKKEKARLIQPEIERCIDSEPHRDFIAVVREVGVDARSAADMILATFRSSVATESESLCASRLIEVSAWLNLDTDARRRVVDSLVVPALAHSDVDHPQAFNALIRDSSLVRDLGGSSDRNRRDQVRNALRAAAKRLDRLDEAETLLNAAGYTKKPVVGKRKDV